MNEIKMLFNSVIETENDPDKKANLELCREYFTNPEFKKALEDHVWELNN